MTPEEHPIDAAASLSEPVFAPVAKVDGAILLATRERVALRLDAGLKRLPLPAATDHAPLFYRSPVVVDRELLIVAGRDGRIHAMEQASTRLLWQGQPGAPFATSPLLTGEDVLLARIDGRLDTIHAEDGTSIASAALPEPILAAWQTDGGLAGVTAFTAWEWNGRELKSDQLPEQALSGGPGVVVCATGRVLVRSKDGWTEAGRLDPRPTSGITACLLWNGNAVVAYGSILAVLGAASFKVAAGSDVLPPVVWNGHLVAASLEGRLWIYAP
jgi:hypothetical protein